jgi:threonine dehydratase
MREPTITDVEAAARLLDGRVHHTPCWRFRSLGDEIGAEAWLKLELLQKTGSFKARGAAVKVASLDAEERGRGVIAVSAGNHACAIAWAAAAEGVSSTIVTWDSAPEIKLAAARAYGGETIRRGASPLEAFEAMRELQAERGLVLAHPYDDPDVVAGQGTVGLEILDAVPRPATVVVPVGGGGLLAGVAIAVRSRVPAARIVGVEPAGAPTLHRALEAGAPEPLASITTIADGLSAPVAGELTLAVARRLVDDVVLVDDDELRNAMRFLALRGKLVAEPGGAAAVAALLSGRIEIAGGPVVAVVSGGNADPALLASVLQG